MVQIHGIATHKSFKEKSCYIYIYIYCHPQTDCFVLSELFSVVRHAGRSKPGSKPVQLYVRLSFRPLSIYIKMSRSPKWFVFFKDTFIYFVLTYVYVSRWHKSFLMWYFERLESTHLCSLNGFHLVMGFYDGLSSLFLSVFNIVYFTPHLLLIYYTLCVCVCVTLCRWSAKQTIPLFVLARNQTRAWARDLDATGSRNGTGERELDKGMHRSQLAKGDPSGQLTPDSRSDQSDETGSRAVR